MKSKRTINDLIAASKKLFGESGWKTKLAEELGVDGSTVRRWVSGVVPVPNTAWAAMDCWLKFKCKPKKRLTKIRREG